MVVRYALGVQEIPYNGQGEMFQENQQDLQKPGFVYAIQNEIICSSVNMCLLSNYYMSTNVWGPMGGKIN